ncbi:hypothetical protein [Brevundimonas vesicularis]|uniref:hypothetical protein n=1 Tax=Brevundimonas vesicularis TaxID=41276 RepID=UPI00385003C3
MPDWFGTVFGVIAGGALTLFAGWLADKRLTDRERERRCEERRERVSIRRSDFQRETLLALQTASQKLIRNTGASLFQDFVAHREGGEWQRQQLPNNLSDDNLHWTTETMLLASRVRDDEVRGLVNRLRGECTAVGFSRDEAEAERLMAIAAVTHDAAIQRIGLLVREIDEVEAEVP